MEINVIELFSVPALEEHDSGLQRLTARTHGALGQMEQKLPDPQPLADMRYPFQALLTQVAPNNHSLSYPCAPLPSARRAPQDLHYVGGDQPSLAHHRAQAAAGSWVNPWDGPLK